MSSATTQAPAKILVCFCSPVGTELYSHVGDNGLMPSAFDDFENINLAADPRFAEVKVAMLAQLKDLVAQWNIPMAKLQPVEVREPSV